jgi:hypothetical protein
VTSFVYSTFDDSEIELMVNRFMFSFVVHIVVLLGFSLYVDCINSTWLDTKLGVFYTCVVHLVITSLIFTKLLFFELIGLASFRLIAHYYERSSANRGAYIALSVNRTADLVIALMFVYFLDDILSLQGNQACIVFILFCALSVKSVSVFSYL